MADPGASTGPPSQVATSAMPSEAGEATPARAPPTFPPYPPYVMNPAPPSVADTIIAGRDIRVHHKSTKKAPVRPAPRPAKPRGPKATDVKLSKRASRAHARCLRRYNTVLTDRLERISKPGRRNIICLWRENALTLPADTISRLRSMLDADEPFKPEQAYEYFVALKKTKKKTATKLGVNKIKKDVLEVCGDKRFVWARNATVAFARGIQQRLARPGRCALADGMLRLSNIILDDFCGRAHMKTPSRRCPHPRAKFMMEMADKVAIWVDEILCESDDRMLIMDFDEDEEVFAADASEFEDDFLDMMGGDGLLAGPGPAYLKFSGKMLEAFLILTAAMNKKGGEELLTLGKFSQTYAAGSDDDRNRVLIKMSLNTASLLLSIDEFRCPPSVSIIRLACCHHHIVLLSELDRLKSTTDFHATEFNSVLATRLHKDLAETAKPDTPSDVVPFMKEMVNICSNYLAQHAEFNKDKGPAFKLLVKLMKTKPNDQLYQKEIAKRTYGKAATELDESKGLESDHDDPNLSQEIHGLLTKLVEKDTPADLKTDMKETLDLCSKYLSQCAIDEIERGPAFDILIKALERDGAHSFKPDYPPLGTKFAAGYTLKSAPGLGSVVPDKATAPQFIPLLHSAVDTVTPPDLKNDMDEVIGRCANYLSAFMRDREKALQGLLKMMKASSSKELSKRNNYAMNYGIGATETETAPILVPYLPVKDISDEMKAKLTTDMASSTPPELKIATKCLIQDVAKHLSQPVAMRSDAAGERYPLTYLAAIKKSHGSRPLYNYKSYGQTYSDAADVLKHAGPLEYDPKAEHLHSQISSEMNRTVPKTLAPTVATGLTDTMTDASKHLAKTGMEKGEALEYLVGLMKEQGESPLGHMQGYQQSYNDGARRIINTPSLANDKVHKVTYEDVRGKLGTLVANNPSAEHEKHLPDIVEESSKFLAKPEPDNEKEKRQVLADLMARKEHEVIGTEGLYKMTYTEAGKELLEAPVGVITAHDEKKLKVHLDKVNNVIPDAKLQEMLIDPANEGSAYITDVIKERGDAMKVIHAGLKNESTREFMNVGKFKSTHDNTAGMIEIAPHFAGQSPAPVLLDKANVRLAKLQKDGGSHYAIKRMEDTTDITAKYIAGVATEESGLDANALAALKDSSEDEEAARRRREEEARRLAEEAERRRREEEEEERLRRLMGDGLFKGDDPERRQCLEILHKALLAKGNEIIYKQPKAEMTHTEASTSLGSKPPIKVDNSVKESPDASRLSKKFEKKLDNLVAKSTPVEVFDTMQDVVIENSRKLAEIFVSNNYKALVKDALISEMQKRGNEIIIEVDGAAESYFFSAQRLKKATSLQAKEPCDQVSYHLSKDLDYTIRCRSMPRKLSATMKDHIKNASDYLSEVVTKPDQEIEAYVAMLGEIEAAGDRLLIEGEIPKSYKDAAKYLRQLTSYKDEINLENSLLQSSTVAKLQTLMANNPCRGYTKAHLDAAITDSTKLLVSYIMLQGVKTEALKILIQKLKEAGPGVLLRHGTIRKSYADGAELLNGKNADQLYVVGVDPVVYRKIHLKLEYLLHGCTPDKYQALMGAVIEDTTSYLAVHFLHPRVVKVCKCMKNVFVQCELRCDEIMRRVARPCCTCSRHVSVQALADLAPANMIQISPKNSSAQAPGIEISLTECPSRQIRCNRLGSAPTPCPGSKPTPGCSGHSATTQFMFYSPCFSQREYINSTASSEATPDSLLTQNLDSTSPLCVTRNASPIRSLLFDFYGENAQLLKKKAAETSQIGQKLREPLKSSASTSNAPEAKPALHWQTPTSMFAKVQGIKVEPREETKPTQDKAEPREETIPTQENPAARDYSLHSIVSTDQMSDWHALMVSLMWNVQAWRSWIQENIDRALSYQRKPGVCEAAAEENWMVFERSVATEALQWRQYNIFSRQLTLRLAQRYRDKLIVSPTRATNKTEACMVCQGEMLEIIEMFSRWTQWLTAVEMEPFPNKSPRVFGRLAEVQHAFERLLGYSHCRLAARLAAAESSVGDGRMRRRAERSGLSRLLRQRAGVGGAHHTQMQCPTGRVAPVEALLRSVR